MLQQVINRHTCYVRSFYIVLTTPQLLNNLAVPHYDLSEK